MAKWLARNAAGQTLGEYVSKSAMFDDLRERLGIGAAFFAVSQGALYAYQITEYGFHPTEKTVVDRVAPHGPHSEMKS